MEGKYAARQAYEAAPRWAEETKPSKLRRGGVPSVVMLRIPDDDFWTLASRVEIGAIADPDSLLGGLLRPHARLLALRHFSAN